jgi:hypothetical protein
MLAPAVPAANLTCDLLERCSFGHAAARIERTLEEG